MSERPHIAADSRPIDRFGQMAELVASATGAKAVIVLAQDADGICGIVTHGLSNHRDATLLLASGIHMNLIDHDAQVRAGAAGEAAQRQAELLDADVAGQG